MSTVTLGNVPELEGLSPALVRELRAIANTANLNAVVLDRLSGPVVHLSAFGAVADSTTDCLPAVRAALSALPSTGGVILLPPTKGKHLYFSDTLDLTALGGSSRAVSLVGAGRQRTLLKVRGTRPGILATKSNTRFTWLSDFSIHGPCAVLPTTQTAGNYGITTQNSGVGFSFNIERVEVRYFADDAIRIRGATGPTLIRDVFAFYNGGYGVNVVNADGESPQDVSVEGGAIQFGWGGIHTNVVYSMMLRGCDIELDANGRYPAVYLEGANGVTCLDVTATVTATGTTPAAVVVFGSATGCAWVGGLTRNAAAAAIHNFYFDGSYDHNVVSSGYHYNTANSGYFASFNGHTDCGFYHPRVVGTTYSAGYDVVNDAVANRTTAFGVKCASYPTPDDTGAVLPITSIPVLCMTERSAPTGVANVAQVYAVDNGGKTELRVIFGSGAAQTIAAEP